MNSDFTSKDTSLWSSGICIIMQNIEELVTRDTDSNTQTNSGPVTTATIPYIRGTSDTIARILQPYNIRVAHKPITTLRRLLTDRELTNR